MLTLLQTAVPHTALLYASTDDQAKAFVRSAIEAMGGEKSLRSIKSTELSGIGHTYLIAGGSFFMPGYLSELMDATGREKLEVKSIFAMHAGVIPWDVIEKAVEKARAPAPA